MIFQKTSPSLRALALTAVLPISFALASPVLAEDTSIDGNYIIDLGSSELFAVRMENTLAEIEYIRRRLQAGEDVISEHLNYLSEIGLYNGEEIADEKQVMDVVTSLEEDSIMNAASYNVSEISIIEGKFEYFPARARVTQPSRICEIISVGSYGGVVCQSSRSEDITGIIKRSEVNGGIVISIKLEGYLETVFTPR